MTIHNTVDIHGGLFEGQEHHVTTEQENMLFINQRATQKNTDRDDYATHFRKSFSGMHTCHRGYFF